MKKYGSSEQYILELFSKANEFEFEGINYSIENLGKPRPAKGECKTDLYVLARNQETYEFKELKISIKQKNADFLENKMSFKRALEIFGEDAKSILINLIAPLEKSFSDDYLIYFKKHGNVEEKSIKIGWKFELINKLSTGKSAKLDLTDYQKIGIYSGDNLSIEKKNAKVNHIPILNSGVANFLLLLDNTTEDLNYFLERLIPIDDFAAKQEICFACKAINYRSVPDKWDGDRPLAVYVRWKLSNNVLSAELIFNDPLGIGANSIGANIKVILNKLKINSENFNEIKPYLNKNIIFLSD